MMSKKTIIIPRRRHPRCHHRCCRCCHCWHRCRCCCRCCHRRRRRRRHRHRRCHRCCHCWHRCRLHYRRGHPTWLVWVCPCVLGVSGHLCILVSI